MRARSLTAFVCALLIGAMAVRPAAAQEQRGLIEGVVKDASGAVLPGATVEVRSPSLIGVASAVSDETGAYRFPALPPGVYEVTATLQGFNPAKVENVELSLGQIKKVDFALSVAGVTETVQVAAESPLIDVRQNAAFANIHKEFIAKLPRGRDFTSVVTVAPGANNESKLAGISIDGASGAENRYVIDGIDTTSIRTGRSAKNLLTDFVEEVQVKSSGYNAEFGGATGGVINVITRSGSNQFNGEFGTYYNANNLNGAVRPSLRLNPTVSSIAEYVTYPDDDRSQWEPGGALGGPLMRDRIWFFGGYMPQLQDMERTAPFNRTGEIRTLSRTDRTHYATGNISTQISHDLRGKFAANVENYYRNGLLHNQDGTSNPAALFAIDNEQPNQTYSGQLDYVAGQKLYLSTRVGYFYYDSHDSGVPTDIRYSHNRSSINFPGVPADLQRQQGFTNVLTNSAVQYDKYTRLGVNFDVTYFANFGGQHTFKTGVQLDRYGNDVLSGEQAPRVNIEWGEVYNANIGGQFSGPFGWYSWRQFQTTGNVRSNAIGLYVQDSWAVNNKLTLNVGIRTERERIPSYTTAHGEAKNAIEFDFADKLAPRVGAAYDVLGDSRWKLYGSWGVFYDITKLELPRGAFGGDKWIEHYYTLDTPNWTTLGANGNWPGRHIEDIDFRFTSNQPNAIELGAGGIDPDLDPVRAQEFTVGLDHELNQRTSLGVRYVHKQIDKTIEDVGIIVPNVGEVYFIANPGYGVAEHTIGEQFPAQPKATRDYDGLEFRVRRRLTDGLQFNASYVLSRLYGNYSGLASSDENGRSSPNVNRFFDGIYMSFDQNARPVFGRLPTDRPHQFKTQVIYDFPFGTTVGFSEYVASGTPLQRQVSNYNLPFFYLGRGSEGRTPTFSQSDLYLQHEFRVVGDRRLQLSLNVLNLFDQDTDVTIHNSQLRNSLSIPDDQFFRGFDVEQLIVAQRRTRDPRFLQASEFQGRRALRFGVKFIF